MTERFLPKSSPADFQTLRGVGVGLRMAGKSNYCGRNHCVRGNRQRYSSENG